MTLAAILLMSLLQGTAASPPPSPSPTPEAKDDGDAATIFTEDGTEIAWEREPDRPGRFKIKKAGKSAQAQGWKKGDEVTGDGSAPWLSDVHDVLTALKARGSGTVTRDKGSIELPYFFASDASIESSPHDLRPLKEAWPILAMDAKGPVNLVKKARGSLLVLNFWASWCGPCVSEMPVMERLHKTYSDRGVYFVGLNMDEGKAEVADYLKKNPVTYPNVMVGNFGASTAKSYSVDGIPLTLIVRADGRIALVGVGFRGDRHEKWLAEALDTLLKPNAAPAYMIHKLKR